MDIYYVLLKRQSMKNINHSGLFDGQGSIVRAIVIAREIAKIGVMNITYNICHFAQLKIVVAM